MKRIVLGLVAFLGIWLIVSCKATSYVDASSVGSSPTPNSVSSEKTPEIITLPTPSESSKSKYKYILITEDCAPWDGAAIKIYLSEKPLDCNKLEPPFLAVSVWKSIDEVADKEFAFPNHKIGSAVKMLTSNSSDWAESGTIQFGKTSGDSDVSFELHLKFKNGEKVDGTFSAKWCKRKFVCGG